MSFLSPAAFALGLLLPVIVALYLLKLRRIEREVSSTYLWRKMVRDVEANAPWQKLRPNLLMFLQLLFLALLILALARPFQWVEGAGGEAAIIILDTSASMNATDVAPNRLESARQRAGQLIDELPGTSRITIIEAGREARVLLSSSLDRRQAHLAVDRVQPGTGDSDMSVSLELASAIASRQPGTEILVLSDGRVNLPQRMNIKGALRYIPFGLNGENQAISLLSLEPSPGNASLTAFVQVTNYGENAASRRLSLYADGLLVNVFDINDNRPGGQKNVIAEGLPAETRLVEAQLEGVDVLALDDRASGVHPDTKPVPVTLYSQGNLFLKTGLTLLPGVAFSEQEISQPEEPAENAAAPTPAPQPTVENIAPSGETALWIFDNYIPETMPDSGSLLFIAPPRSTDFFTTTGLVEAPALRVIDPSDPLVNNVQMNQVSVLDAVAVSLPDWASPVIAGDLNGRNVPLLFRGEINGRRIAVLAFDLRHSDLPLQVAFPLLLTNLIDWLVPGAGSAVPVQAAPGETLTFNAPDNAQSAEITRPDGSSVQIQAEGGRFIITDTTQLGSYNIRFHDPEKSDTTGREAAFAVNLFSTNESSLNPADNLSGIEAQTTQSGANQLRSMREWWRPLVLLALGFLFGEWMVYQRAALTRLRDLLLRAAKRRPRPLRKGNP